MTFRSDRKPQCPAGFGEVLGRAESPKMIKMLWKEAFHWDGA